MSADELQKIRDMFTEEISRKLLWKYIPTHKVHAQKKTSYSDLLFTKSNPEQLQTSGAYRAPSNTQPPRLL